MSLSTRYKWTHPALSPAIQASTQFTYPGGMDGWVYLGDWIHTETVYLPPDPSMYGWESNLLLVDHKSDSLITTLPSQVVRVLSSMSILMCDKNVICRQSISTVWYKPQAEIVYDRQHVICRWNNNLMIIIFCTCFMHTTCSGLAETCCVLGTMANWNNHDTKWPFMCWCAHVLSFGASLTYFWQCTNRLLFLDQELT